MCWRYSPAGVASCSVFRQSRRWAVCGLCDVMLEALADGGGDADLLQKIDSTSIWEHHCAAGGRGDSPPGSRALARWLHGQTPHPRQRARVIDCPARDRRAGGPSLELRRSEPRPPRSPPLPPSPAEASHPRPHRRHGSSRLPPEMASAFFCARSTCCVVHYEYRLGQV